MSLTFFVSYQKSPETGLSGFLGMVVSNYNYDMNFIKKLADNTSGVWLQNQQFYFEQDPLEQLFYEGTLYFSAEAQENTTDNYFNAGTFNADQQIKESGFDDLANYSGDTLINPFLVMPLENLEFGQP